VTPTRLIDVRTLTLKDVWSDPIGDDEEYAILSHMWEKTGETSFRDM